MKCMGNRKAIKAYTDRAKDEAFDKAVTYYMAASAEVLMTKWRCSAPRAVLLIKRVYVLLNAACTGHLDINEIEQELVEVDRYTVNLPSLAALPETTDAHKPLRAVQAYCTRQIAVCIAITLLDDMGWKPRSVDRFIRQFESYVPGYVDGGKDYNDILERLKRMDLELRLRTR